MKMAELDAYKEANPDLIQILNPNATVDPVLLGVKKPPREFQRDVLGQIKKNNRGSTIGSGRWDIS